MDDLKINKYELNDFYQSYLSIFEETTDAPIEFIFTTLLSALGATISSTRWICWGNKKIYPNIWSMLVGGSTNLRKSTSLNIALHFNQLIANKNENRNFILPNDGSFAALLPILEQEKHGIIKHSEVATLLENMSKGYNCNMKSLFTDFFDVPYSHKVSLKKEEISIKMPIFSMGTATTLTWLKQNITAGDRESGFLARFLYCYREKKEKSLPIPALPDQERINEMEKVMGKLNNLAEEEIKLDNSFKDIYVQFYNQIDKVLCDPFIDEGSKSLIGRLQTDYFLKLTILECVLTGKNTATINEANRVIYLINFYFQQATIIMNKILKTEKAKNEEKLLEYLTKKVKANTTELHKLFNNNIHSNALQSILRSLIDAGLIRKYNEGKIIYFERIKETSITN